MILLSHINFTPSKLILLLMKHKSETENEHVRRQTLNSNPLLKNVMLKEHIKRNVKHSLPYKCYSIIVHVISIFDCIKHTHTKRHTKIPN